MIIWYSYMKGRKRKRMKNTLSPLFLLYEKKARRANSKNVNEDCAYRRSVQYRQMRCYFRMNFCIWPPGARNTLGMRLQSRVFSPVYYRLHDYTLIFSFISLHIYPFRTFSCICNSCAFRIYFVSLFYHSCISPSKQSDIWEPFHWKIEISPQ